MERTSNGDYHYPDTSFSDCRWCRGRGCLMCPKEEEDARFRAAKPIFTARLDNEGEMEEARRVIGIEAIEKAFGPGGGGIREIETNCAIAMLTRALRKTLKNPEEDEQ